MPFASNEEARKWRENNPELYKATLRNTSRKRREKLRTEILFLLGDKCSNPYNLNHGDFLADSRCLQIDHINRDAKRREKWHGQALGGSEMYLKSVLASIKTGKKEYQLLCANCNWIKRHENKEHGTSTVKFI